MKRLALAVLTCACASGPRPVPEAATALERLEASELALSTIHDAKVSFVTEAKGMVNAQLTGTIELYSKNVISFAAEGQFGNDQVRVELDTKSGDQNRSLSKGASVSNHKEPVPEALSEALGVMMVRMGLMHSVANLTADQPIEKANGGVREWVKAVDPKDLKRETVGDVACHRVGFDLWVDGKSVGTSNVCIADATALPVERVTTVRNDGGEMVVNERYSWSLKDPH